MSVKGSCFLQPNGAYDDLGEALDRSMVSYLSENAAIVAILSGFESNDQSQSSITLASMTRSAIT